jgi:hypothetical protein
MAMFGKKKSNETRAIKSECKMPALASIDFPLTNRLIVQLMVGAPGLSKKASLYRTIFVRLLDKAIREYQQAREAFLANIAEANRAMHFIAFTDHIETCINAVSRLFKLLDRIKSEKESPAFPRELRKLVGTKSECVANVRNAVEHMDEEIRNDEIAPGKPVMLSINKNGDGVLVSNYEIEFEELAMVLEKMNEIAQYLLGIKTMPSDE